MSFVRKKTIKGRVYLYEVENRWEDGHVRQRVLRYKGPLEPRPPRRKKGASEPS